MVRRILSRSVRRTISLINSSIRWNSTKRLHGPAKVTLSPTEVMVTLLARDAEWFIGHFLDYHFSLGATHILVIDNGSKDSTVEICRNYDRVTVLQNTMPAKRNESEFRAEFSQRTAQGGWILFVDADELVELPLPGDDGLNRLTAYCNQFGYTAVMGQMLDRFSTKRQDALKDLSFREAVDALDKYSLNDIDFIAYSENPDFGWFLRDNVSYDPKVGFRRGGIRREVFGENPYLSKHSLVRNVKGVAPMTHPHCAGHVCVADVTLLLHHYKFAGDWASRDATSVRERIWDHGEDVARLHTWQSSSDFAFRPENAVDWTGIPDLEVSGFAYASPRFRTAHPW